MNKIFTKKDAFISTFNEKQNLVEACKLLRKEKIQIYDLISPFELNEINLETNKSRTSYSNVAYIAGILIIIILFVVIFLIQKQLPFHFYNLGQLPLFTFVPTIFVLSLLLSALVLSFKFLNTNHLFPGQANKIYNPHCSNHCFAIIFEPSDVAMEIIKQFNPMTIEKTEFIKQTANIPLPIKVV